MTKIAQNLTGQKFGRLTVIRLSHINVKNVKYWTCLCSCSKTTIVSTYALLNKNRGTKSCGCLYRKLQGKGTIKHGLSNTITWNCWHSMVRRCHDKNFSAYPSYGGKGIFVSERYRDSKTGITNLIKDIGPRPSIKMQLDRIDNSKGYIEGNIRWATSLQQQRNRRNNVWVTFNGKRRLRCELAEEHGINYATLKWRLSAGWSLEAALTTSVRKKI